MKYDDLPLQDLKQAVALKYDGENAPILLAKGVDEKAQEIIDIAQEHGVPLCDNPALIDLLSRLELGDEIPESLYVAVAYIIGFSYQLTLSEFGLSETNI
jgi:flagellar biosynthesis protein